MVSGSPQGRVEGALEQNNFGASHVPLLRDVGSACRPFLNGRPVTHSASLLEHVLRLVSPEDDRLEHLLISGIHRIDLLGLIRFLIERLQ